MARTVYNTSRPNRSASHDTQEQPLPVLPTHLSLTARMCSRTHARLLSRIDHCDAFLRWILAQSLLFLLWLRAGGKEGATRGFRYPSP